MKKKDKGELPHHTGKYDKFNEDESDFNEGGSGSDDEQ